MIKPPFLVCFNFPINTARRYVREKHYAVAGLGWQLVVKQVATFEPKAPFDPDIIERFRMTGAV